MIRVVNLLAYRRVASATSNAAFEHAVGGMALAGLSLAWLSIERMSVTDRDQGQSPVATLPRAEVNDEQRQPIFTDTTDSDDGPASRKEMFIGCGGMLLVAVIIVVVLVMVFSGDDDEVTEAPVEEMSEDDKKWTPQHIWETAVRWPVTRTITEPITTFLVDHSQGLPASSAQIGQALAIATGVVWLFAWFGSTGARIGWLLMGGGAVAMAWVGAPGNSGPVAAAVTAAAWCVLSIPIARLGRPVEVHNDIDINDRRLTPRR